MSIQVPLKLKPTLPPKPKPIPIGSLTNLITSTSKLIIKNQRQQQTTTKAEILTSPSSERKELIKKCLFPDQQDQKSDSSSDLLEKSDTDSLDFNLLDEIYAEIEDKLQLKSRTNRTATTTTTSTITDKTSNQNKSISQLVREAALDAAKNSLNSKPSKEPVPIEITKNETTTDSGSSSSSSNHQKSQFCSSLSCSSSSYTSASSSHSNSNSCSCSTTYSSSSCGIASSAYYDGNQQTSSTSSGSDTSRPPLPVGPPPPLSSGANKTQEVATTTTTTTELSLEEEIKLELMRTKLKLETGKDDRTLTTSETTSIDNKVEDCHENENELENEMEEEDEYLEPILLFDTMAESKKQQTIATFDDSISAASDSCVNGAANSSVDEDRNNTTNPYCVPYALLTSTPLKTEPAPANKDLAPIVTNKSRNNTEQQPGSPYRLKNLFKLGNTLTSPLNSSTNSSASQPTGTASTKASTQPVTPKTPRKSLNYYSGKITSTLRMMRTRSSSYVASSHSSTDLTVAAATEAVVCDEALDNIDVVTTPVKQQNVTPSRTSSGSQGNKGKKKREKASTKGLRSSGSNLGLTNDTQVEISGPVLISQTFDLSKQNLIDVAHNNGQDSKFNDHVSMCSFSSMSSIVSSPLTDENSCSSQSGAVVSARTIGMFDTIITNVYEEDGNDKSSSSIFSFLTLLYAKLFVTPYTLLLIEELHLF